MSDDKGKVEDKVLRNIGEVRIPLRSYLIWIALLLGFLLLIFLKFNTSVPVVVLSQNAFMQKVESNLIAKATIALDPQSPYLREVSGTFFETDNEGKRLVKEGMPVEAPFQTQVFLTDERLQELLTKPNFDSKRPNTVLFGLLYSLGPILLIGFFVWFFFIRQIKKTSQNALIFCKTVKHLPAYPSIRRDVAMFLPTAVTHDAVLAVVKQAGPQNLESVELFDVVQDQSVPAGQKSAAYAFTYRHPQRALTDAEVDTAHEKLVEQFRQTLQAVVREE